MILINGVDVDVYAHSHTIIHTQHRHTHTLANITLIIIINDNVRSYEHNKCLQCVFRIWNGYSMNSYKFKAQASKQPFVIK